MPENGLSMVLAWAVLGIIAGAAGTELLRKKKPELIEKMEKAATGFVDSLGFSAPTDDDVRTSADEHTRDD